MSLDRITRWVLRHRVAVLATWALLALAGVAAERALPAHLTALTAIPGSDSARAQALLSRHFGENPDGTFTIVMPFGQADDAAISDMKRRLVEAVAVVPTASVIQQRAIGGVLFALVGTRLPLLEASAATDTLRASLRAQALGAAMVTGPPALEHDVRPVLAEDLRNGTLLAVVCMLVLLLLALGWSWAALLPFVVAGAVVSTSLLAIFLVAQWIPMVLYVTNIVELIGLGLAVDYALLLVHRQRQESAAAQDVDVAVRATMRTAGHTVLIAGITAAIGLSVLFLLPVPFVRSLGIAGIVVPLCSGAAALTLQPVLLAWGANGALQSHGWHGLLRDERVTRGWTALAEGIRRRPRFHGVVALMLLLTLAAPLMALRLAPASLTAIPQHLESARAVEYIASRVGAGAVTPHELVIDLGVRGAAASTVADDGRQRLAGRLSRLPGVLAVVTDTNTLFVDSTLRYQRMLVLGSADFADDGARSLVQHLRSLDPARDGYPSGTRVFVGGAPAQGADFLERVRGTFPWLVLSSLLFAYVVLARAFRSRLLPFVAVLLNLVSVAAAIGIVVLVFHFGFGAALIHAVTGPRIEGWALVFLFAMLFGLSMDYQVFLLARIREAMGSGFSVADAVAEGVASTAGVITTAALVFVGALGGLVLGHITGLQELGVGLAVGVLIDATLVRSILLPAVLTALAHRMR